MLRSINICGALLLSLPVVVLLQVLPAYADGPKGAILNSKHDFSMSSTATIRSTREQRVCVFCHAPHNANPNVPLWNHKTSSVTNYGLYSSTTLDATMSQPLPSDSSKLCLSCHDGTVALGDTVNNGLIPFVQGSNYMLPASSAANIYKGTGFADDHPFAFTPVTGSEIQNPPVNDQVKLDALGKVQCPSCHDPHTEFTDPVMGKFLVKANSRSAVCLTCHTKVEWDAASHRQPADPNDDAKYTAIQGAHTGYTGVSNNGCESCHRPHTPDVGARLIKFQEENVCFQCHNGSVANAARNIQGVFQTKTYRHPVLTTPSVHDASEGPTSPAYPLPETSSGAARHAECFDCHNPHSANPTSASPPSVKGYQRDVSGITSGGGGIFPSQNLYQICFKCHGDSENKPQYFDTGNTGIGFGRNPRRHTDINNPEAYNTRLEFTTLVSWHPVVNARGLPTGSNGEVPSLRPYMIDGSGANITSRPLSSSTLIYCTDCHSNDTGRNLGTATGPLGPHGSNNVHLLERTYSYNIPPITPGASLGSRITYSAANYALCNKCHDLDNSILQNRSFKEHDKHIRGVGASCAICHDPHGTNGGNTINNSHLINLDTAIDAPLSSGQFRYEDTGFRSGRCYLRCHGKDHDPFEYKP